jgi:hypothetical protein
MRFVLQNRFEFKNHTNNKLAVTERVVDELPQATQTQHIMQVRFPNCTRECFATERMGSKHHSYNTDAHNTKNTNRLSRIVNNSVKSQTNKNSTVDFLFSAMPLFTCLFPKMRQQTVDSLLLIINGAKMSKTRKHCKGGTANRH